MGHGNLKHGIEERTRLENRAYRLRNAVQRVEVVSLVGAHGAGSPVTMNDASLDRERLPYSSTMAIVQKYKAGGSESGYWKLVSSGSTLSCVQIGGGTP